MLTWGPRRSVLRKRGSTPELCEEVVSTYIQNCVLFVYSEVVSTYIQSCQLFVYVGALLGPKKNVRSMGIRNHLQKKVHSPSLLLKPTPPTPLGQLTRYLVGSIRVTCRSKIAKIVPIGNPRWPPS